MTISTLKKLPNRRRRGFTLLELVVALVVLGILAALAIPTYLTVIDNAKVATANSTALSVSEDAVALASEANTYAQLYQFETATSESKNTTIVPSTYHDGGTLTSSATSTITLAVTENGGSTYDVSLTWLDQVNSAPYVTGTSGVGTPTTTTTAPGGGTTTTTTAPVSLPSTPSPSVTGNTNDGSSSTMTFTWDASTGGTGSLLYYWSLAPGTPNCPATLNSTTELSVTCTDTVPGTTYALSVYAQDSHGNTSTSVGTSTPVAAAPGAPGIPTGVSATSDSPTSSTVSWTDPDSEGSAITGYSIQYSDDSGSTWTVATTSATDTPYTVTGLSDGDSYIFEVAATNAVGTSSFSAPSVSAVPTGPPSIPVPSVTVNTNQGATGTMTWAWAASTDGHGAISYYWNLAPNTATCSLGSTSGLTVTCSDVVPGTTYVLSIFAQDSLTPTPRTSGVGSSSPAVALQVVPGAPTGVSGTSNASHSSSVSWTAPVNDGGAAITGYVVRYSSDSGSSWTTATSSASGSPYSVTGLTDGTSYIFEVAATNAVGTGAFSSPSEAAGPSGVPSVPSPTVTTNSNQGSTGTMTWTWAASTDGSGTITYYWNLAPNTASCSTYSTTSLSVTCSDLSPGTTYEFAVSAQDSLGRTSTPGSVTATAVQNAPNAPTNVAGVSDTAGASAISWTAPTNNGGSAITGYSVQVAPAIGSWSSTNCTNVLTNPCTVTGLSDGTTYVFRVDATNAIGTSSWSASSGSVTPTGAPSEPSPSVTTNSNQGATGTMTFSWAASTDGHGAISYYWNLSPSASGCVSGSTSSLSVTCTNVVPGTSYEFGVYAQDALSRTSSVGSVTATAAASVPGAPTGVSATSGNDMSSTVSWSAPTSNGGASITGYTVTSSPGGLTCSTSGALSCTVSGLTNGTSYTFSVTATNSVGTGPTSSSSSSITPAPTVTDIGYTGGSQSFTVPAGVTSIAVNIDGASGGTGTYAGLGGQVTGTISVTPGEVLTIIVGGDNGYGGGGAGGGSGGSGGGGTFIEDASGNYLAVAGAGGAGGSGYTGGAGGGLTGGQGTNAGGEGGTQSAGGAGGLGESGSKVLYVGGNGSLGQGGAGGYTTGGYSNGGGGGGYYGGGGAGWYEISQHSYYNGGGGGGSSLVPSGGTTTSGVNSGNGSVVLTY